MSIQDRIAKIVCCPSGTCCSPDACYATDKSRSQLVDINAAAQAIVDALPELTRETDSRRGEAYDAAVWEVHKAAMAWAEASTFQEKKSTYCK